MSRFDAPSELDYYNENPHKGHVERQHGGYRRVVYLFSALPPV